MNSDEKLCPYCAETIKAAAIRCKHCHADLAVTSPPASTTTHSPRDSVVPAEIHDLMAGLVEKSLVDFDETIGRYRLLESVRQYTRDRLAEAGEADHIRERHLELFLAFAMTAERHLTGPEQASWLELLDMEHDNLRAALVIPGESALRLAGALWRFWVMRGFLSEGRTICTELLEAAGSGPASTALAAALHASGNLAMIQSDYSEARRYYEAAASMRGELGDRAGEAGSLGNLATVAQIERDFDGARSQFERTLAIHEELGHRSSVAVSLTCLGTVSQEQGDFDSAREFLSQAISLNREIGDAAAAANALNNLGCLEREVGNLPSALAAFEQSLRINRELGYEWEAALNLTNLGNCALDERDPATAEPYLSESLTTLGKLGARRFISACLESWGRLEALRNHPRRSARLFGAAAGMSDTVGAPRTDLEMRDVQAVIAGVRSEMGDKAFEVEFTAGRAMTSDRAIEYALSRGSG